MQQLHGRGYWRLPVLLLEYPAVVDAIRGEASSILETLRNADNMGKTWDK